MTIRHNYGSTLPHLYIFRATNHLFFFKKDFVLNYDCNYNYMLLKLKLEMRFLVIIDFPGTQLFGRKMTYTFFRIEMRLLSSLIMTFCSVTY